MFRNSLQLRPNCKSLSNGLLDCCKLQVIFKSQSKLYDDFLLHRPYSPKFLHQVFTFQCGLYNESDYGECIRHLAVRSGEDIGISCLTNKRVQGRKDIAVFHHLLDCIYSPTFGEFSVLCHENKKYLLEQRESLSYNER